MKLSPDNNYAWGQGAMDFNDPLTKLKALSLYRKDSLPSEKEAAIKAVKYTLDSHEWKIIELLKLYPGSTTKDLEVYSKGTKYEITHVQMGKRTGKMKKDLRIFEDKSVSIDGCHPLYLARHPLKLEEPQV